MSDLITAPSGLNQQIASARHGSSAGQYLTFLVGADQCGVAVLSVMEIVEFGGVTEVPMMPPFVRGIINLRGAVVPVLDLNARFGRACSVTTRRSCIVIVEVEQDEPGQERSRQVLGLVVDAVQAVLDIGPADIEPAPPFGASIRTDYIDGLARLAGQQQGRFVILLKLAPLVAIDDAVLATPLPALAA